MIAAARAGVLAPVAYSAAPAVSNSYISAPVTYAAPALSYAAPAIGRVAYSSAPAVSYSSISAPAAYAAAPRLSYAAPALSYGLPAIARYAAPVARTIIAEPQAPAHYDFGYAVSDPHTGDSKSQQETRRGDAVQGKYNDKKTLLHSC